MDRDWMIGRLEQLVAKIDELQQIVNPLRTAERKPLADELLRLEPAAVRIMEATKPGLGRYKRTNWTGWDEARNSALTAIGVLRDQQELERRLQPDSPAIVGGQLHPWVWDAAKTFWISKHHVQAVEQAWKSINAHTQTLLGRRDISDDQLMNQAFTPNPATAVSPRLRLPGDRRELTWQSRQRGLHMLAQGCAAGIRNVVTHETDLDIPETVCLEYLATLSVLARWVEETQLEPPLQNDRSQDPNQEFPQAPLA